MRDRRPISLAGVQPMSAAKQKGTRFETAVVDWLKAAGFPWVERRALNGSRDRGDISGIPGVVLELKNQQRITLAEWVDEAQHEANNAGAPIWAVIAKRKGKGNPGDAYVVMNLATFAELVRDNEAAS
jgi:hypothetical protein